MAGSRRGNGEGTVYYDLRNKRYEGQFYYIHPVTLTRRRKKLIGKTKKEVLARGKAFILQMEHDRRMLNPLDEAASGSVEAWLYDWLETYIKPTVKVKTYERYLCSIKNHLVPYIGKVSIGSLTGEEIQAMMNELSIRGGSKGNGLSARTINAARRTLKMAMEKARQLHKIVYNPVEATRALKTEIAEINVLSHEQARRLLAVARSTHPSAYTAVAVALSTGMRIGEVFGLLWENVDLHRKTLYIKQELVSTNHGMKVEPSAKTKAGYRQILLSDYCVQVLLEQLAWQNEQKKEWLNMYDQAGVVVCNDDGSYRDPSYFTYVIFKDMLKKSGITENVRFHDLRHTHATWLLEQGLNPKIVAERLGHSSIRITLDTYSHVIKSLQLSAVDKMNEISNDW